VVFYYNKTNQTKRSKALKESQPALRVDLLVLINLVDAALVAGVRGARARLGQEKVPRALARVPAPRAVVHPGSFLPSLKFGFASPAMQNTHMTTHMLAPG
jgi:hypothetical protein